MSAVAPSAAAVADGELERELGLVLGRAVELRRRRSLPYRSSFAIEELELVVDAASPIRLVLKWLDAGALCPEAARARPSFLRDATREAAIYRDVLPALWPDVPALHGSVTGGSHGRSWLLLERVEGVPLWQLGAGDAWEAAARWLARLHTIAVPRSAALPRRRAAWYRRWLDRALASAPAGALDRVAASYGRVLHRLETWPDALVHGEFYPSNVLVAADDGGARLRVVDWESAAIAPGLLDLAALASSWPGPDRDDLVGIYHDAWRTAGGRASRAELEDALEHARLQVALQWIGWSSDWKPPAPQLHDWLGEARSAADRLSL